MPILAIEVLSPKQGTYEILEKFKVYFELGVQSCWLVYPEAEAITVYSSINNRKLFGNGEVIDEVLDIRLPHHDIFE
jgi:Uma2 family endonuclease